MSDFRTIVLFETDEAIITQLRSLMNGDRLELEVVSDGTQLVSTVQRLQPSVVVANPDLRGFNAYDVCKYVKQEMNIPVILVVDKTSTTRAQIDECDADDVFQKPFDGNGMLNVINKHIALTNNG